MKSRKWSRIVAINLWERSRLKNWNSSMSVSFLTPDGEFWDGAGGDYNYVGQTFGNWKEPDQDKCVLVCASDMILNVSN